jgi:hypothetical protein
MASEAARMHWRVVTNDLNRQVDSYKMSDSPPTKPLTICNACSRWFLRGTTVFLVYIKHRSLLLLERIDRQIRSSPPTLNITSTHLCGTLRIKLHILHILYPETFTTFFNSTAIVNEAISIVLYFNRYLSPCHHNHCRISVAAKTFCHPRLSDYSLTSLVFDQL